MPLYSVPPQHRFHCAQSDSTRQAFEVVQSADIHCFHRGFMLLLCKLELLWKEPPTVLDTFGHVPTLTPFLN